MSFVFYFLAAILLYAGLRVITARQPVTAVLHLMLAFFTTSGLWLLLQAEFLSFTLILVYVGAVMVLFLFVVMMLDIDVARLREGFWHHLPLAVIMGLVMVLEMGFVLSIPYLQVPAANVAVSDVSNTRAIGVLMFSEYVYPFELASIVLLVGMIAAILLTLRKRSQKTKNLHAADQIRVKAADRMRIVNMPVEKD